jgi:hypothetical protein
MRDEGYVSIGSRRYGSLASLRRKQWWSFEGLDPQRKIYFVFLALQAFPSNYVSLKIIDYQDGYRWAEDHLGGFKTAPGEAVDVAAKGKWGHLNFRGRAEEGWQVEVETRHIRAQVYQKPQSPAHRDWLLTQYIDYMIQQFVAAPAKGMVRFNGREHPFAGYGYHEHAWGVQPRHSTANWLHFWDGETAGVVLNCLYDHGVPHHYTTLWHQGKEYSLHSPAQFSYSPAHSETPWRVHSPDLELCIKPLANYHSRMQIPPLLAYIDIDYHEQLLEVEGSAWVRGKEIQIKGFGKMDHNWNRW